MRPSGHQLMAASLLVRTVVSSLVRVQVIPRRAIPVEMALSSCGSSRIDHAANYNTTVRHCMRVGREQLEVLT